MHFSHDELITATPQGLQSQMSVFLNTIPSLAMAVRTEKKADALMAESWLTSDRILR